MTWLFKMLSLFWMGLIFSLSSLTGDDLTSLPPISDILGHGALYLILGGLLYFSTQHRRGLQAVIISALYGLSDEFHQSFVPGRTPELKDLIVDITAGLAAVLMIKLVLSLKKSRKQRLVDKQPEKLS